MAPGAALQGRLWISPILTAFFWPVNAATPGSYAEVEIPLPSKNPFTRS
ncbi:MAG: hypothetical protein JO108_08895 [Acidobacteriaceae bacterium]|nr:hypothetical protein [Acidobacteriaceae bacterium]